MPADLAERDADICRSMIRGGSKSFYAASLVLPRRVREPAYALYAFCRLADDAVDEEGAVGAAERLSRRLTALSRGTPADHPADRAFAAVMARHRIPVEVPAALLEGLRWDEDGRFYETLADLEEYAARVAGTVGVMMTLIMGVRDPAVLARACDLGVAMQLSNIARDVGEDARRARLYLPRGWLRAEGIEPSAFLAAPAFTPALGRVVKKLLMRAEALYDRAESGIRALPFDCRTGIGAARILYREIGRHVAERDGNSVDSRAIVSGRRKVGLMTQAALAATLPGRAVSTEPPLESCRFLIDAVQRSDVFTPAAAQEMTDRLARALDIFVAASMNISASRRL
ncbi:MAG: phytoene/squalene synthase family protein, partial [Pseudomonadota bacterium]